VVPGDSESVRDVGTEYAEDEEVRYHQHGVHQGTLVGASDAELLRLDREHVAVVAGPALLKGGR